MDKGPAALDALPAPPVSWAFRNPAAWFWLRPWFDRLALRFIARTYLPLSRGWAAAAEAGQTPERFAGLFGFAPDAALAEAIDAVQRTGQAHDLAMERWRQCFFGGLDLAPAALVAAEQARCAAAHRFMAQRQRFVRWRRRLPPVRWVVAGPEAVAARHATETFGCPAALDVAASAGVPSAQGRDAWLSFRSPLLGDEILARMTVPAAAAPKGTLIVLHGICMEPEMWQPTLDAQVEMASAGWRVLRPEGPWHGRRRLPGHYGGEPAMAWGVAGFLTLFRAWVAEVGALILWARTQGGPVALCGTSLGALTAQLYASLARDWAPALVPDALLLVTTSADLAATAHDGALARRIGAPARLAAAGWTAEALAPWLARLEPGASAVPAERTLLLLGRTDSVTPYAGGLALARHWRIPPENLFRAWRGHFSSAIALNADRRPLRRLDEVLRA